MTNLEAIVAEIEPYSLSDESIEKAFIDATFFFGVDASMDAEYNADYKGVCALCAMYALNRLRVLSNESIGGISQSYDVRKLEQRIRALAHSAGLSPDLVLADSDNDSISFIQM